MPCLLHARERHRARSRSAHDVAETSAQGAHVADERDETLAPHVEQPHVGKRPDSRRLRDLTEYRVLTEVLARTEDLLDRLDRHAAGRGARLVEVIWQSGIGFTLVRVCEGTRRRERAIKNDGGASRYCPACTPRPWTGHWSPITGDLIPRAYHPDPASRR